MLYGCHLLQASKFQGVPILALTATATDKVKEDVTKILRITGCPVFNVSPSLRSQSAVSQQAITVTADAVALCSAVHSRHMLQQVQASAAAILRQNNAARLR